jgi:cytoskeletal protein RodZ
MKLFSRKQQQPQPIIPPELQPYYNMQSHQKSMWRNRQVLLPVAVLLVALLVVGVVVWQIIAQTTSHTDKAERSPQSSQAPQKNTLPHSNGAPAQTPSSGKTNTGPVEAPVQ